MKTLGGRTPGGLKVILYFRPNWVDSFFMKLKISTRRVHVQKWAQIGTPAGHGVLLTSPRGYMCTDQSPIMYQFLCGTTTEWLVKSRKINITPYQWLTNELSISWEQLWESLNQDWPRSVNLRTHTWSCLTMFCQPSNTSIPMSTPRV